MPLEPEDAALCWTKSGNMGRPSKYNRRDQQLNLKFTQHEADWISEQARARRIVRGEFGRQQVLWERAVRISVSARMPFDQGVLLQLSRIGNNLNQIARRMHQLNIEAPAQLAPVLDMIRGILLKAADDDC
ncbi:MAG TPA: plasmid mobilization relaxosome protein MobC [Stellaceae bacterium]|nr:plasmid mobilization relaxosome protein MobC [Stellaceae bacterium]